MYGTISLCAAILLIIAGTVGCADVEQLPSQSDSETNSVSVETNMDDVSASALSSDFLPEEDSTYITLNNDSISVDGPGAEANGMILNITAGGVYTLTGELTDGQIIISAPVTSVVELRLNGVEITSSQNAAIYCAQADKLAVVLMEGTENALIDAQIYTYADTVAEEPDAALFSKVDIVISGSGSLTVNGNFNNGIGGKDDVEISGGNFKITAANHGIRGRDSVTISGGSFAINANNDGIQSNNNEDISKGWILLEGGTFDIISGHDGIQAESDLTISGGDFKILAGGGLTRASSSVATESYKGIKAGQKLEITAGSLLIDSADDSVHSNKDILVSGGTLILATGDDAIHADSNIEISGGDINITQSYEGIEGNNIIISDGVIRLQSEDDGINVAGGNDGQGGDSFSNGTRWFAVTGGDVYVYSSGGDGIDMNGGGEMSGGIIKVFGSKIRGSQSLDYNGSFQITGGTLVAMSSGLMTDAPSTSTHPVLLIQFSRMQPAGTTIALTSQDGSRVFEYAPEKEFQTISICAPELREGQSYIVSANGAHVLDVTLAAHITALSDTGEIVSLESARRGGGR